MEKLPEKVQRAKELFNQAKKCIARVSVKKQESAKAKRIIEINSAIFKGVAD